MVKNLVQNKLRGGRGAPIPILNLYSKLSIPEFKSIKPLNPSELGGFANKIRSKLIELSKQGINWHMKSSLSVSNILAVLCGYWVPEGLRKGLMRAVILSKGHGSLALYSVYAELGLVSYEEIKTFILPSSRLQAHPEARRLPGVLVSSGSLGQGLSIACGVLLAARIEGVSAEVAVVLGDGELDEGQVWEAAATASTYRLGNLVAVVDRNGFQHTGPTEAVKVKEPLAEKWRAFNWDVIEVSDDPDELVTALNLARYWQSRPTAIIVHTTDAESGIKY